MQQYNISLQQKTRQTQTQTQMQGLAHASRHSIYIY